MKNFGMFVSHHKKTVLGTGIALLVISFLGMLLSSVNYDLLEYLPTEFESVRGQSILNEEFSSGSMAFLILEDQSLEHILEMKAKVADVKGVEKVIWVDDLLDKTVPIEFMPKELKDIFYSENSTLMMINFDAKSADEARAPVQEIKKILDETSYLSGMPALLQDTKELADKETPFYVLLAVGAALIILSLAMESTFIPVIFLVGIGFAVAYNMGTNFFLGKISYVTHSLAAVLQLGVTMDYSIFLLHRFEEEKGKHDDSKDAMAEAISKTFTSILGSSLTTIAGFAALGVMKFGIGLDIGIVMAKGVLLGVISTVTILPALILTFEKYIYRFRHKTFIPELNKTSHFIIKRRKLIFALFLLCLLPAKFGQDNADVYYNIDSSLPKTMDSVVALDKLRDDFDMTVVHMMLVDENLSVSQTNKMINEIEDLDGITVVAGMDKFVGGRIPSEVIPADILKKVQSGGYKMLIAKSSYPAATDEMEKQVIDMKSIIKNYDKEGILAGEGALTEDLVKICDQDFKNVNRLSIIAIFAIIGLIFMSPTIPVFLVGAIQMAIFVNMGIPYYTNSVIPFIASIVIGTVQLGTTVDYAILMTTRYREEKRKTENKEEAMEITIKESAKSIITSALAFFGATIGVYFVSDINIIKTLTLMIARGALISMFVILFVLPAILLIFDKVIAKTSMNWEEKRIGVAAIKSRRSERRVS